MHIGIVLPQGYFGEYHGWEAPPAWRRTVALAGLADRLGFDSAWLYDHVHTAPEPTDELTWDPTVALAAIAASTSRIRIGQLVVYAGFRSAAQTLALVRTVRAISGDRVELGMGAGWKEEEARAYGFDFPPPRERLALLERQLAWLRPRLAGVPIVIGGNGREVTMRLAARFADELDLNLLAPDEVAAALPTAAARCEEIGRDPASLLVSLQVRGALTGSPGSERIERIAAYQALGLSRLIFAIQHDAVHSDDAFESLAADALAAGATLDPAPLDPAARPAAPPCAARPAAGAPDRRVRARSGHPPAT